MAKDVIARLKADTSQFDTSFKQSGKALEQFKQQGLGMDSMLKGCIGTFAKFASVGTAVSAALKVAKDAFLSTESGIDAWGRTMKQGEGAYKTFLNTLNGGNWSNFFSNLKESIADAKELYDALDRVGSIKANNQAAKAIEERALATARNQLAEAKRNGDTQRVQELQKVVNGHLAKLGRLNESEANATYKSANQQGYNILNNAIDSIKGSDKAGITPAMIRAAVGAYFRGGQGYMDKMTNRYKELEKAGYGKNDEAHRSGSVAREYIIGRALAQSETALQEANAQYATAEAIMQGIETQRTKVDRWANSGTGGSGGGSGFKAEGFGNIKEMKNMPLTFDMKYLKSTYIQSQIDMALMNVELKPVPLLFDFDAFAIQYADAMKEIEKEEQLAQVKQSADGIGQAFNAAAGAMSSFSSQSQEAANAAKAFTIAGAIATLVAQFASIPKGAEIWSWIAGTIAGTGTLIATIASLRSATEYHAEGGVVGMSGLARGTDTVPAMLTPGEVVLNYAQQSALASNLQAKGSGGGRSYISGEQIVTVVNSYGRRTGRGEILR